MNEERIREIFRKASWDAGVWVGLKDWEGSSSPREGSVWRRWNCTGKDKEVSVFRGI